MFKIQDVDESELVSFGDGFQCGESLAQLFEVMGVHNVSKTLNCDSQSALHLCTNDTSIWESEEKTNINGTWMDMNECYWSINGM